MRANQDIREAAELSGVRFWEIAEKLNIHEANLSRKLRRELMTDEKSKVLTAIHELRADREKALQNGIAQEAQP